MNSPYTRASVLRGTRLHSHTFPLLVGASKWASLWTVLLIVMNATGFAQPVTTVYPASTGIGDAIAVGPNGDIFGCPGRGIETIIRITPAGERSIFSSGNGSPTGIDFDSNGNMFVVNYRQNNVVKITPDGETSVFASGLNGPAHVAISPSDEVFVSEFGAGFSGTGAKVVRLAADGSKTDHLTGMGLQDVIGLAFDDEGNLFVGNWASGTIFKSTGEGELVAFADIPGNVNQIGYHRGFVYAPSSDRRIHRINMSGEVSVLAGGRNGRRDGLLATSTFPAPNSVAFSNDGDTIYVNDVADGALRAISLSYDSDGDGHSDEMEFRAGTDPADSENVLRMLDSVSTSTGIDLRWTSVPGAIYQVLFSTNLDGWTQIGEANEAVSSESVYSHVFDVGFAPHGGFYRVRLR